MKKILLVFTILVSNALAAVPNPAARVDYDGDGKADLSSYYFAFPWNFDFSGNGFDPYGTPDMVGYAYASGPQYPAAGDFDGDGYSDMSFKDGNGDWNIDFAANGFGVLGTAPMGLDSVVGYFDWTSDSCKPVIADYDGDGKSDIAVFCNDGYTRSGWEIDYSSNGFGSIDDGEWNWAYDGDFKPAQGDYDGDGLADIAYKWDYNGSWYINYASNGFSGGPDDEFTDWGGSDYSVAAADYDGDGKTDMAVMYNAGYSTWYLDYSSNGRVNGHGYADDYFTPWGTVPMTPVPSDYDGDGYADMAGKSDYYEAWVIDYSSNTFGTGDDWLEGWGDSDTRALFKGNLATRAVSELTQVSGMVTFSFDLDKGSKVSVKVYDLEGKQVASLFDGSLGAGANKLTWNKKELSEKGMKRGMYFLRLHAGEYQTSKRLVLSD